MEVSTSKSLIAKRPHNQHDRWIRWTRLDEQKTQTKNNSKYEVKWYTVTRTIYTSSLSGKFLSFEKSVDRSKFPTKELRKILEKTASNGCRVLLWWPCACCVPCRARARVFCFFVSVRWIFFVVVCFCSIAKVSGRKNEYIMCSLSLFFFMDSIMVNRHVAPPFGEYLYFFPTAKQAILSHN